MAEPENTGAIRFQDVSVHYAGAEQPAVDGVSLDIEPGALVVLLGPSGCGKTTLLKTVNRLVEPSRGRVLVDGRDVMGMEITTLRRRIGYVIQATGLFPHMSVARNIAVVPRLLGWPKTRIDERVDEMLGIVDLPLDYGGRPPSQLSGGEAQRVGIARALAADPAFLLMDEPFGALDAINRLRLQDELRAIQRRLRRTILFVTHDVDEALRLADRIVVMREGRIVQAAAPLEMLAAPASDFVAELLDADDVYRRLGLMRVSDALALVAEGEVGTATGERSEPIGVGDEGVHGGGSRVSAGDDLREALSVLLRSGNEGLDVVGAGGERVGSLTMGGVQRAIHAVRAEARDRT